MSRVNIIGSGFSSLSAACYLAKAGYQVKVFEKNSSVGGRARRLEIDGFRFDMGPSWYWMPDVFEKFMKDFGKTCADFYDLERLSPSYRVHFEDESHIDIADNMTEINEVFESLEENSSKKLNSFLKSARYNYEVAVNDIVYKPGVSPLELITWKTARKIGQFFTTISTQVRKRIKNKKLIKILEFPVLFLGAKPSNTPAFYNFMNYADLELGTWYPKGGMHEVVFAMEQLAKSLGVKFNLNSNIEKIITEKGKAIGLVADGKEQFADVVLSGADYYHTESLLDSIERSYSEDYWAKKTFAPSALLFYVGFDKKLKNIEHHMLFFDEDFETHAEDIYDNPKWPTAPLFYANFTSKTDNSVAPAGKEAGFFLVPIAPNLEDPTEVREIYFQKIIKRFERLTKQNISDSIIFKKSYSVKDFKEDYNSYKGNAYGLANTLFQTAFLRPKIKSKKVKNLYFTGQLTVPGPGVPPAIISGKISANMIIKNLQKR
jgi:phytoene desaturase